MTHRVEMNIEWQLSSIKRANHKQIIESFKPSEFDSPSRSTVPFLEYWRHPEKGIQNLKDTFEICFDGNIVFDFEHKVPVQKGIGTASHTDLAIIKSLNDVLELKIGIEAKFTEGRYDSCEKWIRSGTNEGNRVNVLEGWLSLLNIVSENNLTIQDVKNIPYQMIHRAASVCYGSANKKVLIYQVFNPGIKDQIYKYDLGNLREVLGSRADIKITYLESEFTPSDVWKKLNDQWLNGIRKLSKEVINALSEDEIGSTEIVKIHHF